MKMTKHTLNPKKVKPRKLLAMGRPVKVSCGNYEVGGGKSAVGKRGY